MIDVLVAMVVLSLVGVSFLRLQAEGAYRLQERRAAEAELAVVERLLAAHALLSPTDLNLRLGTREVGDFFISVQRPAPDLYRIGVGRLAALERIEVETMVFRPRPRELDR